MNENDIYKLKYYKYKNKYIELKNRYNQEGGVPPGYYAFFLNKILFEQVYKVHTDKKLYYKDVSKSTNKLSLSYQELSKLNGIRAIMKNGQTTSEAVFPTRKENKCTSTQSLKLFITDTSDNCLELFDHVNECLISDKADYCLIFFMDNSGKISLKKEIITQQAKVALLKAQELQGQIAQIAQARQTAKELQERQIAQIAQAKQKAQELQIAQERQARLTAQELLLQEPQKKAEGIENKVKTAIIKYTESNTDINLKALLTEVEKLASNALDIVTRVSEITKIAATISITETQSDEEIIEIIKNAQLKLGLLNTTASNQAKKVTELEKELKEMGFKREEYVIEKFIETKEIARKVVTEYTNFSKTISSNPIVQRAQKALSPIKLP